MVSRLEGHCLTPVQMQPFVKQNAGAVMLHSKNTEQLKADTERKEGGKQETVAACRGSQVEEQSQCLSFYQESCRSAVLLGKKNLWDKAQTWSSPVL